MYQYEDLFIKISNDFHAELNPILEQINAESNQSYWFDKKGIQGKFYIINNLLLSMNGNELKQYQLTKLTNILEAYKMRLTAYFNSQNIATCFVYFTPESIVLIENYFNTLEEYRLTFAKHLHRGYLYMVGMEINGFPNDCSYKLTAKISDNEILIEQRKEPLFDLEIGRGKQIGNPKRTRKEHEEIEYKLSRQNPGLRERAEDDALQYFTDFAKETHVKITELFEDFDNCTKLCKTLIEKQQKDISAANLPKIEKIYLILKNGFIQEPFERFREIFQPGYAGEKIIWYKYGYELKYFVDELRDNMKLPTEINKWTIQRFVLESPIKRFPNYLSKQIKHPEYSMLKTGNRRTHPLSVLFKEL